MDFKAGQKVKVVISKPVNRAAARKTLERLFMKDKAVSGPIAVRSANFVDIPKRRGGRIWTKYAVKLHATIVRGKEATLQITPQVVKDLNSLGDLVQVTSI